jgi:hypothetical protein
MPTGQRPDPPAHSVHLTVGGTYGGDTPIANTFWVRNGNAQVPTVATLDSLALWLGNAYVAAFLPQLSNALVITNCDAYYYGTAGIAVASSRPITGTGGKAGVALPANVALAVGWQVSTRYRGGHPRTYLVGPASDRLVGGRRFLQAYIDGVRDSANSFHAQIDAYVSGELSGLHLGIVSFVNRKEWRSPPIFRDFVPGGAHADTRVDSMRRRLGRDVPP